MVKKHFKRSWDVSLIVLKQRPSAPPTRSSAQNVGQGLRLKRGGDNGTKLLITESSLEREVSFENLLRLPYAAYLNPDTDDLIIRYQQKGVPHFVTKKPRYRLMAWLPSEISLERSKFSQGREIEITVRSFQMIKKIHRKPY